MRHLARRATDTINGGEGVDELSYAIFEAPSRVYFPVRIDVPAGEAHSLDSGVEMNTTFSNFERYIGSDQNDSIQGGLFGEFLAGLGGDDDIKGGFGGDEILGGGGIDTLRGEGGDDKIFGDNEADFLYGDAGGDLLTGGMAKDTFDGGEPEPPDEETDTVADWDNALMESCSSAIGCP